LVLIVYNSDVWLRSQTFNMENAGLREANYGKRKKSSVAADDVISYNGFSVHFAVLVLWQKDGQNPYKFDRHGLDLYSSW
jgi:hypothetical protein